MPGDGPDGSTIGGKSMVDALERSANDELASLSETPSTSSICSGWYWPLTVMVLDVADYRDTT